MLTERDFAFFILIPVPVDNQVMSDAVQPGGERISPVFITLDMMQSPDKDPGAEILCVLAVAGPVINIVVDLVNILFV